MSDRNFSRRRRGMVAAAAELIVVASPVVADGLPAERRWEAAPQVVRAGLEAAVRKGSGSAVHTLGVLANSKGRKHQGHAHEGHAGQGAISGAQTSCLREGAT